MSYKLNFSQLYTLIVFFSLSILTNAQDHHHDIGTPANSPFQLEGDLTGSITNTINQITGKVAFSVPIASINSRGLGHQVSLVYNGQTSFKIGKEQNKYSPTSTVGVGWSLPISKIIVDNKQTAAQDDDDFYIFDGSTTSKLICTKRDNYVWEFKLEKYSPWIIKYFKGGNTGSYNVITGQFEYAKHDYWEVIKQDGNSYYFGYTDDTGLGIDFNAPLSNSKSKEQIVAWGNWIGDSKSSGGQNETIVWNLSKINDQWGNYISFNYQLEEIEQSGTVKHTEASYLKSIVSSNGSSIQMIYENKLPEEYFEPHTEINEPDAYQERYEKKFLSDIEIYNFSDKLTTTYNLNYTTTGFGQNNKRYLTSVRKKSHKERMVNYLPAQSFEYYLSGDFKGGLKKIIYPSGGSITYNYQKKNIFYNGSNRIQNYISSPSQYEYYACFVDNKYSLKLLKSINPISRNKYRFKIYRYWWNGEKWENHEFSFPNLIEDSSQSFMKNFYSVMGKDFYAFVYDEGSTADLYIFKQKKNGEWDYSNFNNIYIGNGRPNLMAGEEFIALGSHHTGDLYTYYWGGYSWRQKKITQGNGQFYYSAKNNFILSLDEDGGTDMINGRSYQDNYYIHYLDASKNWNTKSWSSFIDPKIGEINDASYFYPSNAMTGFVADNHNEFFLRWNSNYNLKHVDDVLGHFSDIDPIQPIGNGLFSLTHNFYGYPKITARFNGQSWKTSTLPSSSTYYAKLNFGRDIMTFQNHDNIDGIGFQLYNPNTENFSYGSLDNYGFFVNDPGNGITKEFIIAGDKILKKTTDSNSPTFIQIGNIQDDNAFTYTNGLNHAYIENIDTSNDKAKLYFIKKDNGQLANISLNYDRMRGNAVFGKHYNKFISLNTIWLKQSLTNSISTYLYRIIDDKINNQIYDNVVSQIELDDKNGATKKIKYSYIDPSPSPDNSTINYGEVTTENKGYGSASLGKIKRFFDTGESDLRRTGLIIKEQTLNTTNDLQKEIIYNWYVNSRSFYNENGLVINTGYSNLLIEKDEKSYLDNGMMENQIIYEYNNLNQLFASNFVNSQGKVERKELIYAHEHYNFMSDRNMLNSIYEEDIYLNNELKSKKRNIFIIENNKAYLKERFTGPSSTELRINNEVTKVDYLGDILETSDGKMNFNCTLRGYSNLHEVASIKNAEYDDVVQELDVTYSELQNLNTHGLKNELIKLYDRLPDAVINLTFYDIYGRIISQISPRKKEVHYYYDVHDRLKFVTDEDSNVIEYKDYNFSNN